MIFGVGKLPEVGQALGKGIREFRGAADGGEDDVATATPAKPAAPAPVAVEAPRPAPVVVEAPRPAAAPVQTVAAPAAPLTAAYTVVSGDTPDTVARSHGVTVEELLSANGWSQRDRVLYEGDKIQIPAKPTA